MTTTRKRRGAETPALIAAYLREHGWPYATDTGAGRNGGDILNTPGLLWEVKARRDFTPTAWLRQAHRHGPGLPLVVWRPDGLGPAHIETWGLMLTLGHGIELLRHAGYGEPVESPAALTTMPGYPDGTVRRSTTGSEGFPQGFPR